MAFYPDYRIQLCVEQQLPTDNDEHFNIDHIIDNIADHIKSAKHLDAVSP